MNVKEPINERPEVQSSRLSGRRPRSRTQAAAGQNRADRATTTTGRAGAVSGRRPRSSFRCARCGRDLVNISVEKDTTCPGCRSPLHSCSNCTFFDTGAPFECRKELEARVEIKDQGQRLRALPAQIGPQPRAQADRERPQRTVRAGPIPNDPRAAFDALFKK